jgi:hypothetical protein
LDLKFPPINAVHVEDSGKWRIAFDGGAIHFLAFIGGCAAVFEAAGLLYIELGKEKLSVGKLLIAISISDLKQY